MAAAGKNGPLAPHIRPCAPRQHFKWMDNNPPSLRMYFGGGLRVCMALKVLLCSSDDALPQHWSVLRAIHTFNSPKNYIRLLGGCQPFFQRFGTERKASCEALGGYFCRQRPWSALVVLVDVGHWRLKSDQPTVGIVKIVFVSFLCKSHTFSTSDPAAKKRRLRHCLCRRKKSEFGLSRPVSGQKTPNCWCKV
jgi:hypothetical protein